ncbi:hypothetical protein VNO80_07190 [Phaseolus coccineus]|uniref:Uncharacterized protein n=1 Tax=Phaseolus coccineus TaxID=3886 RepID=A0AAN9NIG1_PHACN
MQLCDKLLKLSHLVLCWFYTFEGTDGAGWKLIKEDCSTGRKPSVRTSAVLQLAVEKKDTPGYDFSML